MKIIHISLEVRLWIYQIFEFRLAVFTEHISFLFHINGESHCQYVVEQESRCGVDVEDTNATAALSS